MNIWIINGKSFFPHNYLGNISLWIPCSDNNELNKKELSNSVNSVD